MTTLEDMMETLRARARAERDEFQEKHPHYTPPPWAGMAEWLAWRDANIKQHGMLSYLDRFKVIEAEFAVYYVQEDGHRRNYVAEGDALLLALQKASGVR